MADVNISKDRLFELLDQMVEWDNEWIVRSLQDTDFRSEEEEREAKKCLKLLHEGYVEALKSVKAVVKIWGTTYDVLYEEYAKEEVEDDDNQA